MKYLPGASKEFQ